ncbi:hypothetical protein [Aquipuribacter nitratireducens]|uniref:Phosphoribosyltransferase n=1 Tax=Aquipuribacter nitratireducens TaxID=650104 RepID=A0ABW0GPL4_9MICO
MEYRSVADLGRDVVQWADRLPRDIDIVAGIPRSGLLAANLLALHLHTPLADLEGLLAGRLLGAGQRMRNRSPADVIASARRILVVDDSLHYGGALAEARDKVRGHVLEERISYGVVYAARLDGEQRVDYHHSVVPVPRAFEWNVLHHTHLGQACMDIDGVLCRDPEGSEADGAPYEAFIDDVPPRLVPAREVGWLVTSRLERYRPQTERWLAAHGIRYKELVMHPAGSHEERRAASDHAERKAEVYRRTSAWLFIESDVRQAQRIAEIAGRPVFCTDVRQMVYPGVPVGRPARRLDQVRWRLPREVARNRERASRFGRRLLDGLSRR